MKTLNLNGLYNHSGMFCDKDFVNLVANNMQEIFDLDELVDPVVSFDVAYDGWFEIEVIDFAGEGKDYYVFKVRPLDHNNDPLADCICGEAHIRHADWETLIKELELGEE